MQRQRAARTRALTDNAVKRPLSSGVPRAVGQHPARPPPGQRPLVNVRPRQNKAGLQRAPSAAPATHTRRPTNRPRGTKQRKEPYLHLRYFRRYLHHLLLRNPGGVGRERNESGRSRSRRRRRGSPPGHPALAAPPAPAEGLLLERERLRPSSPSRVHLEPATGAPGKREACTTDSRRLGRNGGRKHATRRRRSRGLPCEPN